MTNNMKKEEKQAKILNNMEEKSNKVLKTLLLKSIENAKKNKK